MKQLWALMIMGAAALLPSCTDSKASEVEGRTESGPATTATFTLQQDTLSTTVLLPAELSGYRRVDLHAKVAGYVRSLHVDIGSRVQQGQLLATLEAPEIHARMAAALSRMKSQEAVHTASQSTYDRLLETSKVEGTISPNDLDQALARKNADQARLEASQADYHEVANMSGYLEIRAPFSGTITGRNVNEGAYVGGSNNTPMLTLQETGRLRLTVAVPEAYTAYLGIGDELSFTVNAREGETFSGKVGRMSGALDSRLRAEQVEADVDNQGGELMPGMIGQVRLSVASGPTAFVVPRSAVMTTSEGDFVIKVAGGKALWTAVRTGLGSADRIQVFSAELHANDALVLHAGEGIREGGALTAGPR